MKTECGECGVSSHDDRFTHLDQLLESLGYEMESDTPEIGVPVATGFSEPADDWSSVSLDEEVVAATPEPSEEEQIIEQMLAELDSPGESSAVGSEETGGGDFLDLGGGFGDGDDSAIGGEPVDEYTRNALANAPMWDDEVDQAAPASAGDEPAEETEDSAAGLVSDVPDEERFTGNDDTGADLLSAPPADDTDFASDLDALLGGDSAADEGGEMPSDETGESDLLPSLGLDDVAGEDAAAAGLDDEMSDFLAELESADVTPDDQLPAVGGDDLDSLLAQEVAQAANDRQQLESTLGDGDLSAPLEGAFDEGTGIDDLLSGGGLPDAASGSSSEALDGFESLPGMDDFGDILPEESAAVAPPVHPTESLAGFDDVDLGFGAGVAVPAQAEAGEYSDDELDLTDEDIERVRKRMLVLTPKVRDAASRAIAEDRVSSQAQNKLVRMLLNKAPLDEVREFLEKETGENLSEADVPSGLPEADFGGFEDVPERQVRASSGGSVLAHAWPVLRVAVLGVGVVILGMLLYLLLLRPGMTGADLMNKGLASLGKEEYVAAEEYFRKGETYLGKEIEWYRRYGDAYRGKKEYGRAIKKLQDGLTFAPKDFETLMLLGDTHTEAKDFEAARTTFGTLAKLYPKSLKVPEKMGDLHIAIGDASKNPAQYEMARLEYQKILDADWKNLDGQFKTMRAYVKMRKLQQAGEKLKQIYNINAEAMHVQVLTEYSALLQDNGKWFDSRTILGKVLKKDWEHAPAHFYMSRYWREQLDQGKALINLKHAVRIDRNNAVYHNETGEVLLELPKPEIAEATRSFTTARELDPEYPKPYVNLGNIYYEHLTPGDSGDINLEEQNYQQALENYENALRRMPESFKEPRFFYSLGWLYYRKGRYEDALTAWQRIYVENPFHPTVSFSMGNAWLHLKKDVLATAEYEKVLRYYETIASRIPAINPEIKRHQNVFGMLVNSHNNIGVAWEMRHQRTRDAEWERKALMSFWKAREIADRLNRVGFEYPENNIRYILHRDVKRGMAIAPELGKGNIPKYLNYERQ